MVRALNLVLRKLVWLMAAAVLSGCAPWQPIGQSNLLLKPIELADDGIELELITVRFPLGDETLNGAIWNEIDEQQTPLAVRRALEENGIRTGIVGGQLPPALAQVIAAAEKQPETRTEAASRLEETPPVSRQQMQLHSGWHGEIVATETCQELPLLMCEDGQLCGRTYPSAQGILESKAHASGDRRVTLHITPELQYGEVRQKWASEDGRIVPQQGKPKRMFESLAFDATLSPGQLLVLTTVPERSGTLGQFLFTESPSGPQESEERTQKLLVVRLAQSRYSDLFAPADKNAARIASAGKKHDSRE
jgi:hypothetical protein